MTNLLISTCECLFVIFLRSLFSLSLRRYYIEAEKHVLATVMPILFHFTEIQSLFDVIFVQKIPFDYCQLLCGTAQQYNIRRKFQYCTGNTTVVN